MNEEEKVVSENDLEWDGEITLLKGKPFTGVCVDYYKNGQKASEVHYKDGREEGLWTEWSEDGIKYIKNIISEIVQEWPEYKKSRKTDSRSKGCALLNCPMI